VKVYLVVKVIKQSEFSIQLILYSSHNLQFIRPNHSVPHAADVFLSLEFCTFTDDFTQCGGSDMLQDQICFNLDEPGLYIIPS